MKLKAQTLAAHRGHPRRREEHTFFRISLDIGMGSSPQAQGTSRVAPQVSGAKGVIPAGAGNIASGNRANRPARGHPRRRGEHACRIAICSRRGGSSPQARGTCSCSLVRSIFTGVIPAGAGNIDQKQRLYGSQWGHPRRRGEHSWFGDGTRETQGSSPQARGT